MQDVFLRLSSTHEQLVKASVVWTSACVKGNTVGVIMNLWDSGIPRWYGSLMTVQPGYLEANLIEDHTTICSREHTVALVFGWSTQGNASSPELTDISWGTALTYRGLKIALYWKFHIPK